MGATRSNSGQQATASATLEALLRGKQRFLAFVERRVGSRAIAEDILQDAFVRSVERAVELDRELAGDERATAWFYRVLRNAVVDYYRHRDVEQRGNEVWRQDREHAAELNTTMGATLGDDEYHEVCGCFREFVHLLKPEYTRAIEAVELRGQPLKDFAAAENITLNNATVRVHRARQALREHIQRACSVCAEHGCLDCHCKPAAGKSF